MKKHSLFKMIAITLAIAVILTWIFPITYYGYSYTEESVLPVGIFELFKSLPTLFNFKKPYNSLRHYGTKKLS